MIASLLASHDAAAFAIGPETALDPEPVQLPGFGFPFGSIACGTTHCVAAWSANDTPRGGGVIVARIDASSGEVLDLGGRWLGAGVWPAIACRGDDCLVAWSDGSSLPAVTRIAHVDAMTGVIGASVNAGLGPGWSVSPGGLACGRDTCLLTAMGGPDSGHMAVRAMRVDPATSVVRDPGGFSVSSVDSLYGGAQAGCDGDRCLVLWTLNGAYEVRGRRVDLVSGSRIDPTDIDPRIHLYSPPPVACGASQCLVAWVDSPASTSTTGMRIDLQTGAVGAGFDIYDPPTSVSAVPRSLACAGDLCTIAIETVAPTFFPIGAARVRLGTGEVLGYSEDTTRGSTSHAGSVAVGCAGAQCIVGWSDGRGGVRSEIFGTRFDSSTGEFAANDIAIFTDTLAVTAARASGHGIFAWTRYDALPGAGWYAIHATTLDAPATTSTHAISVRAGQYAFGVNPSMACESDGTRCLLGCDEHAGSVFWSVDAACDLASARGESAVLDTGLHPTTSCSGNRCLAAWEDRSATGDLDVFGAFVDASREPPTIDTRFAIATGIGDQTMPRSACSDTRCAVVWQQSSGDDWDLAGARVDLATRTLLDSTAVSISEHADAQSMPAIGCDGSACAIAWQDTRNGHDEDIYAARWNLDSASIADADGVAVASGPSRQQLPAIGCAVGECWIAWQDLGTDASDVVGARFQLATGVVRDPGGLSLSPDTTNERGPAVLAIAADRAVVGYYRADAAVGETRVFARAVTRDGIVPGVCIGDSDCASGHCVGGACAMAAACVVDAGAPDASIPDAGIVDAVAPSDTGRADAGPDTAPIGSEPSAPRGCGCRVGNNPSTTSPHVIACIALLAVVLRRHRRKSVNGLSAPLRRLPFQS